MFHWANRRIGFEGDLPTDGDGVVDLVRRVFPGFDEIGPVVRELLLAPEGRLARLADADQRRRAAETVVVTEAPALDAAETAALAVELILDGARRRARSER